MDKLLLKVLKFGDFRVCMKHFAWRQRADVQWMEVSFMFLSLPFLGHTRPHSAGGQEMYMLFPHSISSS